MREYWYSLTRIFSYKNRILDSVLIRKNTLSENPYSRIFYAVCETKKRVSLLFIDRGSHRRCSVTKDVLRNFAKFTGKHLCQRLFFNKVAGLRVTTLLRKKLWHRYFPVNFAKFLATAFLQNTSGWLLLYRSNLQIFS